MKESIFINGNVLTKSMLLLGINVYFIYFLSLKFKIWDLVLEFFFIICEFNFIFILRFILFIVISYFLLF